MCSQGSCSKSFWDSPLVEGPGRHVHPKTTTFCLVLGFTPSTQPSRAHQSQNDFEQLSPERPGAGRAAGRRRGAARGSAWGGRQRGRRRLCPRETHGRPWPCEWVARRHCVKSRGERQYVAKTRHERSGKRRDGAKRKVSEGSSLRRPLTASYCGCSGRGRRW